MGLVKGRFVCFVTKRRIYVINHDGLSLLRTLGKCFVNYRIPTKVSVLVLTEFGKKTRVSAKKWQKSRNGFIYLYLYL